MHCFLAVLVLISVAIGIAHAQQGEKGNSIIPFPRVGRSGNSPGLIPFPRIGRAGGDGGLHEMKRQLIPFPRVGKRAYWHLPLESAYYTEYEDFNPMLIDPSMAAAANFLPQQPSSFQMEVPSEDGDVDKRGSGNSGSGGMWFGPRLGRKKRDTSSAVELSSEHNRDTTIDMKPLLKMLHNSNWAIIMPIKERRNFTPRLGRKRAQPFSPRLGRSGESNRSPSSSSAVDEDEVETNLLVQRRGDDDTNPNPPGPPFSPRLGRSDHFSPRLGRADPFSPRLGRSSSSTSLTDERD